MKSPLENHPYFQVFHSMKARCQNERHRFYKDYGGRGITVCERWMKPRGEGLKNFIADMGDRPPDYTLERIDNNGGYSPENCKWASKKDQARNRRGNVFYSLNGVTKTISQWAELAGISGSAITDRIKAGYPLDKALTEKRIMPIPWTAINAVAEMNRARTHCANGHELNKENVYLYKGRRNCRICINVKRRAKRAELKKPH